jgi:hypothetical protein
MATTLYRTRVAWARGTVRAAADTDAANVSLRCIGYCNFTPTGSRCNLCRSKSAAQGGVPVVRRGWTASDFHGEQDWCVRLDGGAIESLRRAAREAEAGGLEPASVRAHHGTAELQALAGQVRTLLRDIGFAVVRGLPVDDFSEPQLKLLYALLGAHLGNIVPQTVGGTILYSVRDAGVQLAQEYGRPGIRRSQTNAAFDFHTDSPSRLAGHTPDYVGLLVLRTAKSGGESALVSACAVHEIIRRERPECLARLYRPFWVDRRAELPPGEEPVLPVPVFRDEGRLTVRYLRFYIHKGHEVKQEPLGEADLEALDVFDSVMQRSGVALLVRAERGDIQIVDNKTLLHSRAAYEDYSEPELKRHYLRMWIAE